MDNENKYIVTQWVDELSTSKSECKYVNTCYNTQSVDNDVIITIIMLRSNFVIKFVLCFSVNMEAVKPDHRSQYGLPCHSCHVRFSLLRTKWIYMSYYFLNSISSKNDLCISFRHLGFLMSVTQLCTMAIKTSLPSAGEQDANIKCNVCVCSEELFIYADVCNSTMTPL